MESGVRCKITEICNHCPNYVILKFNTPKLKCYKRWIWNFKNGNFDLLRYLLLNAHWADCYVQCDVNQTVSNWMMLFQNCADLAMPHLEVTIMPRDKHFMNSHLCHLMRLRKEVTANGIDLMLTMTMLIINRCITE